MSRIGPQGELRDPGQLGHEGQGRTGRQARPQARGPERAIRGPSGEGGDQPTNVVSFIASQRAEHGVSHAEFCQFLGVSASWFYKWRDRAPTPCQRRPAALDQKVKESFKNSGGNSRIDGSPRVHADLVDAGWKVSEKTVADSIARQGLVARRKRRFRSLTWPDRPPSCFRTSSSETSAWPWSTRSGARTSPRSRPRRASSIWPAPSWRWRAASTATTRRVGTAAVRCTLRSITNRSKPPKPPEPPEPPERTRPRSRPQNGLKRADWYSLAVRCHAAKPIRKPPRFRGKPNDE